MPFDCTLRPTSNETFVSTNSEHHLLQIEGRIKKFKYFSDILKNATEDEQIQDDEENEAVSEIQIVFLSIFTFLAVLCWIPVIAMVLLRRSVGFDFVVNWLDTTNFS